jgi:hypothetical protein
MKHVIATMFIGIAALMLGTEIAFAAEKATELPLGSVYTTTRQKNVKDAGKGVAELLDEDVRTASWSNEMCNLAVQAVISGQPYAANGPGIAKRL